jgi:sugar phosphate permease
MHVHPADAAHAEVDPEQRREAETRAAFMKAAWRLVPFVTIGYLLNYMDRNNVGFAALTMNRDTGLTATEFGFGAGVLFFGYSFFEIPSNMALYRFGARRWIARIMITWGLVSAATAFVSGPQSWYALRFLLGVAEAGFFPGITFYLATWFPAEYRARMLAWFLVAIPASTVVGGADLRPDPADERRPRPRGLAVAVRHRGTAGHDHGDRRAARPPRSP